MIDSCANDSGRSEEGAGCRTRPRDDGTVRWRFRFRYGGSFSGMSLNAISEFASSTSASEWDDDERRLDSSTRVPSSRVISASNVGSPSERELSSVLVLVPLVLVVGEGRGAGVLSRFWWW